MTGHGAARRLTSRRVSFLVKAAAAMRIVQATLTKLATDDGLVVFRSNVELGARYLVDLDSIERGQTMIHRHADGTFQEHCKDIVWTLDVPPVWLPLDCLKLEA